MAFADDFAVLQESEAAALVSPSEAAEIVERAFADAARKSARNFAVVREGLESGSVYGLKSGYAAVEGPLGVKIGGYWSANRARGAENHQSMTILADPGTGETIAVVSSNALTGLRTAAAAAVSIRHLARRDSKALAIIGTGVQAPFHLRAALAERPFKQIAVAGRSPEKAAALCAQAAAGDVQARVMSIEDAVRSADVVITITPAKAPLIRAEWVQPGTHFACMGADTRGKQKLEPAIVQRARLFTDERRQAVAIGECQHAAASHSIEADDIVELGQVILGAAPGRRNKLEITLFDGTGVALQDLYVAALAVKRRGRTAG